MTPAQITLLQASFDRLWPVNEQVVDLFYDRLFLIAPHTRSLFPDDMQPQKAKFIGMLASVIGLIERQDLFESQIVDLGRRHVGYGIGEADYAPVGEALLWSLEHALAPHFTDEMRSAWTTLYQIAQNTMIEASRQRLKQ
jgi:hemoglobin-like flavoprotein